MSTNPSSQSNLLMPALVFFSTLTLALVLLVVHPGGQTAIMLNAEGLKAGRAIFLTVCAPCHSPTAHGIKGLGKPLIGSQFFDNHSDVEVLAFLQTGRPVNDPLNTTGVVMPARGGRLTLTDEDLSDVIAYIRSLNLPTPGNS